MQERLAQAMAEIDRIHGLVGQDRLVQVATVETAIRARVPGHGRRLQDQVQARKVHALQALLGAV